MQHAVLNSLLFLSLFCFSFQVGADEKAPSPSPIREEDLVEYLNSYPTLEEWIHSSVVTGFMKPQDGDEIREFLQEQKVDLKVSAPPVKWQQGQFTVGKIGWKYQPDVGYKTLTGRMIKLNPKQSVSDLFKMAYWALQDRPQATRFDFWIPKALAEERPKRYSAEKDIVNSLGQAGARLSGTVVYHMLLGSVYYGLGGAINGTVLQARKFIFEGSVECRGARYFWTKGYKVKVPTVTEMLGGPKKVCEKYNKKKDYFTAGASDTLCEFMFKSDVYLKSAMGQEADQEYVLDEKVKQFVKGTVHRECTPSRAQAVEDGLKAETEALFNASKTKSPASTGAKADDAAK